MNEIPLDIQIPFDTQIIEMSNFIIDKIKILDKNLDNKEEIDIIMNKLFEVFCSKLVDINKKKYLTTNFITDLNEINTKIDDLSIIIINLLNYKMLSNELNNKKKIDFTEKEFQTDTINLELSIRINNFKSLIEFDNDNIKDKTKSDLLIIFEALSIIVKKNLKKIGDILLKIDDKEILLDILDQFKLQSEIYMKLLNYKIII
jgi:hypothetical protein